MVEFPTQGLARSQLSAFSLALGSAPWPPTPLSICVGSLRVRDTEGITRTCSAKAGVARPRGRDWIKGTCRFPDCKFSHFVISPAFAMRRAPAPQYGACRHNVTTAFPISFFPRKVSFLFFIFSTNSVLSVFPAQCVAVFFINKKRVNHQCLPIYAHMRKGWPNYTLYSLEPSTAF